MKSIDYKVPNGKMLRIDVDLVDDLIKDIKITGDFFIHPDTGLEMIENELTGARLHQIKEKLDQLILKAEIKIIGFDVVDIVKVLAEL